MAIPSPRAKWPRQMPISFDATASSLVQDAQNLVDRTKSVWDGIVSDVQHPSNATFTNTILPIAQDENASTARLLRFYASTSPSKELRDASNAATKALNDADTALYSRTDVFVLVDAVLKKIGNAEGEHAHLDDQSKHYVRKLHRKMYQNGCGLGDSDLAAKEAFEQVNKRIQELVRQCTSNLHEDPSGVWLSLEELEGVPDSQIAALRKQTLAVANASGSEGDHAGKLWVKTKLPHPNKVLANAKSGATRKKLYYAIKNRLPQNIPLFRELVLARDTLARMLGYSSYLAYKTVDKMLQAPETVTSLLAEIRQKIRTTALADVAELLTIKKEEEGLGDDAKFFAWDEDFYLGLRKQRDKPDLYLSSVPEYFELHNTLASLLSLYGRLFGTRFERIALAPQGQSELGGPLVWHEDVQIYAVWDVPDDATGAEEFLGYAYFDLFPRDGKYGHRGCYALSWGYSRQPQNGDGDVPESRVHPSCVLVMNFPKPAEDGTPTLLSLLDVRRLFHELGHLHHTLCTKVKYAGLSFIDRDFGEAPSLMLERFFWKPSYIKDLAHHYSCLSAEFKEVWLRGQAKKTNLESSDIDIPREPTAEQPPQKLPDRAIAELADTNPKQFVNGQVFNLFLSLYDILVHHPATHEDLERMNLAEEFNKLHTEITGFHGGEAVGDGWEWAHGESVFRMAVSGYDAGYYSYVL
jgi:metallopeptidase MepB